MRSVFAFREVRDEPKPLVDHLEDLRKTLFKMSIALGLAMVLSFVFRTFLFEVIQRPLACVDLQRATSPLSLGVVDSFSLSLEMALYAGVVLSFPFLLWFLAEFILPALTVHERRCFFPVAAIGFGLFLLGVAFAYFVVLPQTLKFFFRDAQSLGWQPMWTVKEYISFATQFLIAFGLAFELPVAVLLLVKLEILDDSRLRQFRPHAFALILVFAAVLTPTQDMVTLFLMGLPMYVLYEICILIASFMARRKIRDSVQ